MRMAQFARLKVFILLGGMWVVHDVINCIKCHSKDKHSYSSDDVVRIFIISVGH